MRLEAWRNAQDQGALAARNMLGAGEAIAAVPWFWSDQYDLTLQIAGLPDEGATTVRRDLGDGAFILFHLAADGRLVAASGIGPRQRGRARHPAGRNADRQARASPIRRSSPRRTSS